MSELHRLGSEEEELPRMGLLELPGRLAQAPGHGLGLAFRGRRPTPDALLRQAGILQDA